METTWELSAFCSPSYHPLEELKAHSQGRVPLKKQPSPQPLLSSHCRAIPPTSWSTSACSRSCGQQGLCFAVKLDFVPFPSTPLVTSGKTVTWKRQMGQGKSCLRFWQSLPHTLTSTIRGLHLSCLEASPGLISPPQTGYCSPSPTSPRDCYPVRTLFPSPIFKS